MDALFEFILFPFSEVRAPGPLQHEHHLESEPLLSCIFHAHLAHFWSMNDKCMRITKEGQEDSRGAGTELCDDEQGAPHLHLVP